MNFCTGCRDCALTIGIKDAKVIISKQVTQYIRIHCVCFYAVLCLYVVIVCFVNVLVNMILFLLCAFTIVLLREYVVVTIILVRFSAG